MTRRPSHALQRAAPHSAVAGLGVVRRCSHHPVKALLPSLLVCLTLARTGASDTPLDLAASRKVAVAVDVPRGVNDIQWLLDLWECAERSFPKPPDPHDAFPHLDFIDFRDSAPRSPSSYTKEGGVRLRPECKGHGHFIEPFYETVNIYKPGFTFGGPQADFFTFKRDPANPPSWFVLEHQVSGEHYLFRRAKPKDK